MDDGMDDDIRALYQEVILDHGKNPRNFRHPEDAPLEAHGNNPLCGDKLTVYVRLGDGEKIEDAAFEGRGCAISIASASMMTGILRGKTVPEMERLFGAFHHMCTGEGEADAVAAEEFSDEMDKCHQRLVTAESELRDVRGDCFSKSAILSTTGGRKLRVGTP